MMEDMARRLINAENNFIETICERAGCSPAEGKRVLDYYRKNKLIKLQAGIGRYTVKHGAYLDTDILKRAIELSA